MEQDTLNYQYIPERRKATYPVLYTGQSSPHFPDPQPRLLHIYFRYRPLSAPGAIRGPEIPGGRHLLPRDPVPVRRVEVDIVAPPVGEHGARVGDAEEDDDAAEGEAGVQRRGEDVVVLAPPGEEAAFDEVVEDEVDEGPAGVVDSGCCGGGRVDD